MPKLKAFLDWVIYGNFWIAAGAAAMCWQTYYLLDVDVQPLYIALAFAATFFIYNVDRLAAFKSISGVKSERHIWITQHVKPILFITAFCALFLAVIVFFLPWNVLIFLAHLGLISIGYSIPFIGKKSNRKSLRSIHFLKIFLIAYVWMAATAWLPAVGSSQLSFFTADAQLIALKRFLFVFALTLPFDIRDFEADKKTGIKTLPIILGEKNTKILAQFLTLVFCILSFIHFYPLRVNILAALLISAIITSVLIAKANTKKHEYYYTGLMDAMLPLQAILVWLAQEFVNFR